MDFDISPLWKGQHTFLKPVIFSPGQVFSGVNCKLPNQNKGSISFFDGKEWKSLGVGNAAQSLIVTNGLPSWGNIDISTSIGILSAENGGTGISKYEAGSMLFANSKNNLSKLAPGKNNQILTIVDKIPSWCDFSGVTGNGKSSYLAVWSSKKDICETNIQIDNEKLILKEKNSSILIGDVLLSSENDSFTVMSAKESLALVKDTFSIQHNNKAVVKFWKGKLTVGSIPVDRIDGTLDVSKGGTGMAQYSVGSIVYASSNDTLSALSIDNSDGFYLKAVNGRPQWAPIETVSAKTTNNTTLELSPGTQHRAPLQFQVGELTSSPQIGAIEWDGQKILVTTKDNQRKALLFDGENINSLSKGVFEPVLTNMGGTGRNLSNKPIGSLLFIESNSTVGILSPEPGAFIRFDSNSLPILSHAVQDITSDGGIVVSSSDKYVPHLSIDQTSNFSPIWSGVHTFVNGLLLGTDTTLNFAQNIKSGLPQIHFETCQEPKQKQNGDMWFNNDLFVFVNGSTVNVTAQSNTTIAQVQHLRICEGVSPVSNTIRKIKYPLPYGSDGVSKIKWKFVRADLRIEESPSNNDGKLRIYVNGDSILESELTVSVGSQSASSQHFIMPYAYSGDLISIEFGETGGGDCWSLYLTVISDNS